jgi:hypothetical protein
LNELNTTMLLVLLLKSNWNIYLLNLFAIQAKSFILVNKQIYKKFIEKFSTKLVFKKYKLIKLNEKVCC